MFRFAFQSIEHWPSLAWLARCRESDATIEILHGPSVEIAPERFCEAVWAGSFEEGGFDESDLIFGSGGRIRANSVSFVSSGTTLDRLQSIEIRNGVLVSNSLPCLLQACDGQIDLTYTRYIQDFDSIVGGIDRYKQTLATSRGAVRLTYFNNLFWDGHRLTVAKKKEQPRDLGDFAKYRKFLDCSLRAIEENMSSVGRKKRLSMVGTMSSGYDSATVSALALPHGLKEAFSFRTARGGDADTGSRIADALGIKLFLIDRDGWRKRALPEIPFLATQASGGDVFFSGAEEHLRDRVLLTGFRGDNAWGTEMWQDANALARGDNSGSGLTEYRLWRSFIHIPVPFFAARQSTDIVKISQSREMDPWRLSNSYDRPICRRVLEGAGVPRNAFGMAKRAVSVIYWQRDDNLTPISLKECRRFLRARGVRIQCLRSSLGDVVAFALRLLGGLATMIFSERIPSYKISVIREKASKLISLGSGSDPFAPSGWVPLTTTDRMFQHVFPWALDIAKRRYDDVLGDTATIQNINLGSDTAMR